MASSRWLLVALLASGVSLVTLQHADPCNLTDTSDGWAKEAEQFKEEIKNSRHPRRTRTSNQLPEFVGPIGNVTAVLGRDVRLICTVENLGSYQVAWLKEESKTILSIDTNIIITNYRIFLIPDEEERKWVLHIKDVQESDRGFYQCQVNTSPMRSTSGYLEVVVPPTINESQTSQIGEVMERSNVSLQCRANGHPRPNVFWRRDDGQPIRLSGKLNGSGITQATSDPATQSSTSIDSLASQTIVSQLTDVKSDKLSLNFVDRSMAGIYVCSASNGIPSNAIKKIPLYVKFAPQTSVQHKYISVSLGDQLEVDCQIEAFPKPNSYWSKKSTSMQSLRADQPNRWLQTSPSLGNTYATSYQPKQLLPEVDSAEPSNYSTNLPMQSDHSTTRRTHNREHNQPEPQAYSMQFNNHPHNRIQLRLVDQHLADHRRPLRDVPSPAEAKAYVTVKQTAINSYTFKLKLTIAKIQHDDYGEYSCISTNTIGTSESHIIVTAADKSVELGPVSQTNPDYRSVEDSDYQRDQLESFKPHVQQSDARRSSSGNRVVYDENYLQAIKTRQNNFVGSSRSQKLKSKNRNSASNHGKLPPGILLTFVISFNLFVVVHLCRMIFVVSR